MHGQALFIVAIIIFVSKILTDFSNKINVPPVLFLILFGIIIGPTVLNLASYDTDYYIIKFFSEIGVLLLLFMAGMHTDIKQIKMIGKNSFIIAACGVFIPLILGYLFSSIFFNDININILLGMVLTATSVSVTVMTLMELKKLNTVEGNTIVWSAIIDDILCIILLTFVLGFIGVSGISPVFSIIKISSYLIITILAGIFFIPILLNYANNLKAEKAVVAIVISLILIFSFFAEKTELAGITGAYIIGVFIGQSRFKNNVERDIFSIGHTIFISTFFVFIGMRTNLFNGGTNYLFVLGFSLIAILSKIIGPGIAAKFLGFDWQRSIRIGIGMAPRGEVALVIAAIGISPAKGGVFNEMHFNAIVFMVIITVFVSPLLLKYTYKNKKNKGGK